jgi:two-component system, OmpR family, phosphate regulon sensor histidine kinase PhoR
MALPPLALALVDALEEPALLVSGERTLAANPPARTLLGPQLVGQNIRFAIRQPQVLDAILARRAGRLEVLGLGGVDRSSDVSITRLLDELLLIRISDSSARRAAERAQVDFVANASHELRTPLAAVIGYSETIAEEGELPESVRRRFGEQIHVQARRMMRIIEDLMGLSRIEADRFSEPRHLLSLAELVSEAVEACAPLAESRQCRIALEVKPELGPVRGDAGQLRQVVDNLLHNAMRYGCRSSGEMIEVRLEEDRNWQRLTVRDFGEGVAAEHLPRLTERFYRVDAARSRDSGGTGLGLAIVKQVVDRHRGLLDLRSRPGKGLTVEVRLPRVERR